MRRAVGWAWLGWNDPRRVSLLSVLGVGVGLASWEVVALQLLIFWWRYRWNLEVSMAAAVGGGQQGSRDASLFRFDGSFNRLTRW